MVSLTRLAVLVRLADEYELREKLEPKTRRNVTAALEDWYCDVTRTLGTRFSRWQIFLAKYALSIVVLELSSRIKLFEET